MSFIGVVLGQVSLAASAPRDDLPSWCQRLGNEDFSQIVDAPAQLTAATAVPAAEGMPDSCELTGYVAPSVGFVLALPHSGWNGKLIQVGCGGFCGAANIASCDGPRRRGYACIASDNGHRSTPNDALWSYNNLQAEVDHGFRATHVTALAGKAIVARAYGQAATRAYFVGGSTGGRQALIAAQRFPWDFDGIIAGAPSLSVTGIHMNLLWGNRAFTDATGTPLFTAADLERLHRGVLAKCDLNDGVEDGLIGDPRLCTFQPTELRCTSTRTRQCLSAAQVAAVEKIYSGAVSSRGEPIYMPGALRGGERAWLDWFSRLFSNDSRALYKFVREQFRYATFDPDPGPTWNPEDFDFDRDYRRLGVAETLSSATNPDLRRFKAASGKLLVYAGWSDAGGMPLHTVDYYETVERLMGGRANTRSFFRLFMIPGMGHGIDEAVFAVDWLSYLEAWVERERPPEEIVAFRIRTSDLSVANSADLAELARRMKPPLNPAHIEFSRPVYPYPIVTRYRGRGNKTEASSFGPHDPAAPLQSSAMQ